LSYPGDDIGDTELFKYLNPAHLFAQASMSSIDHVPDELVSEK
jgi:hypothetical protein